MTATWLCQRSGGAPGVRVDVVNQNLGAGNVGGGLESTDDVDASADHRRCRCVQTFARQFGLVAPLSTIETLDIKHGLAARAGSSNRINRIARADDGMRRAGVKHRWRVKPLARGVMG